MLRSRLPPTQFGRGLFQKRINVPTPPNLGNLYDTVIKKLFGRFPRRFRAILDEIGDRIPTDFVICRSPVQKYVTTLLNIVSFGQFESLMRKFNFDKFFHLYLVFNVDGQEYALEKNEVLTLSRYSPREGEERMPVGSSVYNYTLNEILQNTINRVGEDRVVKYSAFSTNCQLFIRDILETLGLYSDQASQFVYQDVSGILAEMNPYVADFAQNLTDIAGGVSQVGQELGFQQGGLVLEGRPGTGAHEVSLPE